MPNVISLELPPAAYEQLRLAATRQNRPVAEVVKDIVLREIPELPTLPADIESELKSFSLLSDDVLWLIARSSLQLKQQMDLAKLNDLAQRRQLTAAELTQQQYLADSYDRLLIRRAQAALALEHRGYDLSDPTVLHVS